jgi:hypothetical protein
MLQGEKQCRSASVAGTESCAHDDSVVAEHGSEAVKRSGHLPTPRKRVVQAAVIADEVEPRRHSSTRSGSPLSNRVLRRWMARYNTVIMTVLLLLIGMKLIGDAISGFSR